MRVARMPQIRGPEDGRIHAFCRCAVTSESILSWAAAVANDWRWLAVCWHVALAVLVIAVVTTRHLSQRLLGILLALPVASVAAVAWMSRNPFNGLMFTGLAVLLLRAARCLPEIAVARASPGWVVAGTGLVGIGWVYPHFLTADTWTAFAYASPFGLLPCPTLLVVIGITLIYGGLHSRSWSVPLSAVAVGYGVIGVFTLEVLLDVFLLAGAALLGAMVGAEFLMGPVRAADHERIRRLPGDEFIPTAAGTLTHAVTIAGSPDGVWPWLVQMGAGSRAGWYSYDCVDNGGQPSAWRIVPELQCIAVGTVFPALPGITEGFVVLGFEQQRWLILAWPNRDGVPSVTWAFVLEPSRDGTTRLIVRARADERYRFHGLPKWLSDPAVRLVHFVMQRKQLTGIAQRAESSTMMRDAA